jgi:hypothetical protein
VLQILLLGFHLLDFAANARYLLFDFQHVLHLAGTGAQNILEALLGFAGVFQARDEIGVLLRDFFTVLGFDFDAAECF